MIVRWSWRRGGRTWLGEVGDDADGVGNGLQARVRGAEALPLVRGRARARFVHRHGVVVAAAADLVVLLLPHIARALKPTLRPRLRRKKITAAGSPRPGSGCLLVPFPRSAAQFFFLPPISTCRFERQLGGAYIYKNKHGKPRPGTARGVAVAPRGCVCDSERERGVNTPSLDWKPAAGTTISQG